MRFRHRQTQATLPEVNLIPMLNVMMGILAFFVMITMTLTTQEGVEVPLPDDTQEAASDNPEPLVVQLTPQGILVGEQAVTEPQLTQQIQRYLATQPQGIVVLQPEPDMPYDQVLQLLGTMKDRGGDRVSLAID